VKVSDLNIRVDSNTDIHWNKNGPLDNGVYRKPTHAICSPVEESGFDSWQGQEFFSSPQCSDLLRSLPNILSNVYKGLFLQKVKQLGHEADLSSPSGAEVKNATPPYVSMARWLMKHRDKFS
jgi:hypothetical protein